MINKNLISILEKNIEKSNGAKKIVYEYWKDSLLLCFSDIDLKRFAIRLKVSAHYAEENARKNPTMHRKNIAKWRKDVFSIVKNFYS